MFSQSINMIGSLNINENIILSEFIIPILHKKFCDNNSKYYISFPNYRFDKKGIAGNIIKVVAESEDDLIKLDLYNEFKSLSDYVQVSINVQKEDDVQKFKIIKGKCMNRVKRYMLRGNDIPDDNMIKKIKMYNNNVFKNAYLNLKSNSNGNKFKMYFGPLTDSDDIINMHINTFGFFANNI